MILVAVVSIETLADVQRAAAGVAVNELCVDDQRDGDGRRVFRLESGPASNPVRALIGGRRRLLAAARDHVGVGVDGVGRDGLAVFGRKFRTGKQIKQS